MALETPDNILKQAEEALRSAKFFWEVDTSRSPRRKAEIVYSIYESFNSEMQREVGKRMYANFKGKEPGYVLHVLERTELDNLDGDRFLNLVAAVVLLRKTDSTKPEKKS